MLQESKNNVEINKVKILFMILEKIDSNALLLESGQNRNFEKWPILGIYVWPNNVFFPSYKEEVYYLKAFYTQRLEWLKTAINEL